MNLESLFSIDPYRWSSIATAIFCGVIVGLERQLRGKPVGIRTSALIVLGTYVFIASSMFIAAETTDPSRIIGQVITGIGFLGAGVMLSKDGAVIGVTSAATIWTLAAIGVCIAIIGSYVAIKLSFVVVAILYGVDILEGYSSNFTRGVHSKYSRWRKRDVNRED
ncbi:MAG: MgtC/SapB family protein [Marinomonas foliarum]|jgi:putative Mg2+ transporter-C (MgtC) family protein|uniref:Protein MgtC n=1 Tax=Marinomonas foliarum TaxID=491950 RepID=A0A369AKS1_9GAMM|nr:MgtC/SapB family protein [Marinomonas foliarum]QRV24867.1 MgtC/SapB family protein [Marinomonas foliarum]RCX08014.1 putative Mg2+ transporter-C (MgtC) family protein [Marinomonas foliarum]